MNSVFFCVFAMSIICYIKAKKFYGIGSCPDATPMDPHNFVLNDYFGKWYEISKYPFSFEKGLTCVMSEYSALSAGSGWTVNVTNSGVKPNGVRKYAHGRAYQSDPVKTTQLSVSFAPTWLPAWLDKGVASGNYWILDTDHSSYSLVHSCTNYGLFRIEGNWVFARQKTMSAEKLAELKAKFAANNIKESYFEDMDNASC